MGLHILLPFILSSSSSTLQWLGKVKKPELKAWTGGWRGRGEARCPKRDIILRSGLDDVEVASPSRKDAGGMTVGSLRGEKDIRPMGIVDPLSQRPLAFLSIVVLQSKEYLAHTRSNLVLLYYLLSQQPHNRTSPCTSPLSTPRRLSRPTSIWPGSPSPA